MALETNGRSEANGAGEAVQTRRVQTRREFLGRGVAAGAALGALGTLAAAQPATRPSVEERLATGAAMEKGARSAGAFFPGAVDEQGQYVLPPLPYDYDALEPHIDAETMRLHHDKHHAGYVKGLIAAEEGIVQARTQGNDALLEYHTRKASFNGGGHFLHCVFWACMAPKGSEPSGELASAIERDFGGLEGFRKQFTALAKGVEGSGWGMMAWSIPAHKLILLQVQNHNLNTEFAQVPLLVVDVWEHAYYKKYSNDRAAYIQAFMKVINWDAVAERHALARRMAG